MFFDAKLRRFKYFILAIFGVFISTNAICHPMPNSLILLNIQNEEVYVELQLPVQEFELAYGKDLKNINQRYIQSNKTELSNYILAHLKIASNENKFWSISIIEIHVDSIASELNGVYKELIYKIKCQPKIKTDSRKFTFQYDAIIHQVVTHFAIIKIKQDFNNGIVPSEPNEIGIIQLDIATNTVKPFSINIDEGSKWNGFKKMVSLGMHHIKTGIDHLLFLFVILLITPLLGIKKWETFGGLKYTLVRIFKIVTAFTIGHSVTLIIVTFFPIPNFSQSIEIAIAFTILISAIHAIRPIFPKNETLVTFLFGLIHGSAFASTLYDLQLETSLKVFSVLGFNIGIEIMQFGIILLFSPILFLSKFSFYKHIRIIGGVTAIIASIAWIFERITNNKNFITGILNNIN